MDDAILSNTNTSNASANASADASVDASAYTSADASADTIFDIIGGAKVTSTTGLKASSNMSLTGAESLSLDELSDKYASKTDSSVDAHSDSDTVHNVNHEYDHLGNSSGTSALAGIEINPVTILDINDDNTTQMKMSMPVSHKKAVKPAARNASLDTAVVKMVKGMPIDGYLKWYMEEYSKQLQFNKMPNIASADMDLLSGSVLRMQNITQMKYAYTYDPTNMIVIVMKLYDYESKQETNYGTLFCELANFTYPIRYETIDSDSMYGNAVFTFFSATPSYISYDGEYRSQFARYSVLCKVKKAFANIWDTIETYVTEIKLKRQWSIYASYFYPKLEQADKNTEIAYAVKHRMVLNTLLIVSWFNAIYDESLNMTKSHVNKVYRSIILKHAAADIDFLKSLVRKFSAEHVELFRQNLFDNNGIGLGTGGGLGQTRKYMQCGYKMIPLNIKEVQEPLQLRYKPWREYFISNKCNDLVVNSIAPGFPIILDWFYIKNSKKGLFDNKSQYDRLKNSELAKDILRSLYEAQNGTYFASENFKETAKSSSQIKKWINIKFKRLNEKIEEPINYTTEEIIMSEVTLAFANEYVGRTFADCFNLVQNSKVYESMIGSPFKDIGYDYFAKYMFEICYALFCINSKFGLMHGDFHLNNATIGSLYTASKESIINKDKINKVAYIIADDQQYVFPNNGYFGCLIDFSRGIINPHTYDIFCDTSLPKNHKLVANDKKFISSEINNLLSLYVLVFPNKIKQREELTVLLKNNFDVTFKLLTALDIFMFSTKLLYLFRHQSTTVGKKCIDLVVRINKLSESFITADMNNLISNTETERKRIENSDYPMLSIIKKCFPEYLDGMVYKNIGVITDVYCYNNEMKYSATQYGTFPDFMKSVKYYDGDKLLENKLIEKRRADIRTEYEKMKLHSMEMITYISMRHLQKNIT